MTTAVTELEDERTRRRRDIVAVFVAFGHELDEYTDRRERLVKLSREVTIKSKRVIFALHRSSEQHKDLRNYPAPHLFTEIKRLFHEISTELSGQEENFWRYHKAISPGLQEYIEAVSFAKYLQDQTLLSFTDLQHDLKNANGIPFFPLGLPPTDYLLGISDLTGELMRFAISSVGSQGLSSREVFSSSLSICNFVRDCKASLDPVSAHISELRQKQEVTTASLRKIEEVVYSLSIRGLGDARMSNFGAVDVFQHNSGNHNDDD